MYVCNITLAFALTITIDLKIDKILSTYFTTLLKNRLENDFKFMQ